MKKEARKLGNKGRSHRKNGRIRNGSQTAGRAKKVSKKRENNKGTTSLKERGVSPRLS